MEFRFLDRVVVVDDILAFSPDSTARMAELSAAIFKLRLLCVDAIELDRVVVVDDKFAFSPDSTAEIVELSDLTFTFRLLCVAVISADVLPNSDLIKSARWLMLLFTPPM